MIPKNLRYLVIKEMEKVNLIERANRDSIKILKCDVNIEEDRQKLAKIIGL